MEPKYEAVRQGAATLGLAIVIAAAILGWSMPNSQQAPKYQGFVVDNKIVRLDARNGNIVACDFQRCVRVLGNGKDLQPNSAPGLVAVGGPTRPAGGERVPAPIAPPAATPRP